MRQPAVSGATITRAYANLSQCCSPCAVEVIVLSSGHDRAPSLRLHRTVPAVQGGASTLWPSLVVMAFCLLLVLLAVWMG